MPAPLKGALVRETARRGSNVNDVAVGILADEFGVRYTPTGRRRKVLAGGSPVLLLRVPQELKDEIHAEASRRDSNANDVILAALADGLGVPRRAIEREGNSWPARTARRTARARRTRCASRSSAWATAPTRSSRESSTTRTRSPRTRSPVSCTSTSAGTTSRTSSSPPRSTSSRARSASTSPTRSGRIRTTRSSSRTSRRPASRSRAA